MHRGLIMTATGVATILVVAIAWRPVVLTTTANPHTGRLGLDPAVAADPMPAGIGRGERVPPDFEPCVALEAPERLPLAPGQDFGFIAHARNGWNPPDPDLAVGPEHLVVAVNGSVRFFTKAGEETFVSTLNDFWPDGGNFVFDPVELYDRHAERFVLVATEHQGSVDLLDVAISDDDDPNGDWHTYRFDVDDLCGFIDFPNLGVDDRAIYVATDCFDPPGGNTIWIIDKEAAMEGEPTEPVMIRTSGGFRSTGAVKTYDRGAPAQYFATASEGFSHLTLDAVHGPLDEPVRDTVAIDVPGFSNPPGATQRGSSNRVATTDRRIKNGVYRNGSLWLTHTIGQGGVARVRWYELAMNGWPAVEERPTVVQVGTIDLGAGIHTWFADLDVDARGNMAIAFNRSSQAEFVGIARAFRLRDDPPGTLQETVQQQTSTAPELGDRWGDYGGVHQDPVNREQFWNTHEFRTTSWRTWVATFVLPVPPCPADLDESGFIDFGDVLPILAVWGPCDECPEDLDENGAADVGDILLVIAAWGDCPT